MNSLEALAIAQLSVCAVSEARVMLMSSMARAQQIGRSLDGVIGHSWLEWCVEAQVPMADRDCQRCLAGEPTNSFFTATRPDGTSLSTFVSLTPGFDKDRKPIVLGFHREVPNLLQLKSYDLARSRDVAEYINELAQEFALMANEASLMNLASTLARVAQEAGDLAEAMRIDAAMTERDVLCRQGAK